MGVRAARRVGLISLASAAISFSGCSGGGAGAPTAASQAQAPLSTARDGTESAVRKSAAAGTQLFYNDFENGSSAAWTPVSGTWSVCQNPGNSREYCTPGNAARADVLSVAGDPAWSDYEVDTWIVPGSTQAGTGTELIARYVDAAHFDELELRNISPGLIWGLYKNNNSSWTQLGRGPFTYTAGGYYHLRLVASGPTLTAYATRTANDWSLASETLLGQGTDTASTHGRIGLRAIGGASARFDNIGVYGTASTPPPSPAPSADPRLTVPAGFYVEKIANVGGARELAAAANGDLLVGTEGRTVAVVPGAENAGAASAPQTLITLAESPAQGIALGPSNTLYVGTNTALWKIPYHAGDRSETSATKIAAFRTGPIAPGSDGDVHQSSSVATTANAVYVAIGSSCNACTEVDPTRATIQRTGLSGENMTTIAKRIRNAMALAVQPVTGTLWAGGAGQDNLAFGHPEEYFDPVTVHALPADYGWPACEENHQAYIAGSDCSQTVAPRVEFPAYSTLIGAAFYPAAGGGSYAFPAAYRGGAFVSIHGSWHSSGGVPVDPPHVAYVGMSGDTPATGVDYANPTTQWTDFFRGFQDGSGNRIGRTSGVAVGSQGSLFVADDQTGNIYRIRPGTRP